MFWDVVVNWIPRIIDGVVYKLAGRKDIIFGLVMTLAPCHVSPAIFYISSCLGLQAIITARRVFLAFHLQSFRSSAFLRSKSIAINIHRMSSPVVKRDDSSFHRLEEFDRYKYRPAGLDWGSTTESHYVCVLSLTRAREDEKRKRFGKTLVDLSKRKTITFSRARESLDRRLSNRKTSSTKLTSQGSLRCALIRETIA